jgi:hypothetical protein
VFFKSTSHPTRAPNNDLTEEMVVVGQKERKLSSREREKSMSVRRLRTDEVNNKEPVKMEPAFYGVRRVGPPTHHGSGGTGFRWEEGSLKSRSLQHSQSLQALSKSRLKAASIAAHSKSACSQSKYRELDILKIEAEPLDLPISHEMSEGLEAHIISNIGKGLWEDEVCSEIARPLSASSFCSRQLQVGTYHWMFRFLFHHNSQAFCYFNANPTVTASSIIAELKGIDFYHDKI